jgi:hypothetical protein
MAALTAVWRSLTFPARVLVFRFPSNRPIIALNSRGRDSKREANKQGGTEQGSTHGGRAIDFSMSPATCDL